MKELGYVFVLAVYPLPVLDFSTLSKASR